MPSAAMLTEILCLAAGISLASARAWHVSPSGNDRDGDGSKSLPFRSLAHACKKALAPGDSIRLAAGRYVEEEQCNLKPGVHLAGAVAKDTNASLVTSSWDHSKEDGNFHNNWHIVRIEKAPGAGIAHLDFDGDGRKVNGAITTQKSDQVRLHHLRVREFRFVGLWLKDGKDIEVHDCRVENSAMETGGFCAGNISLSGLTDSRVHRCTIRTDGPNTGYGIKRMGFEDHGDLVRVKLDHLLIDVKESAAWNGGLAPNMSIELHDARLEECEIAYSDVNMHMSIVGKGMYQGTGKSIRIHHNRIRPKKGYGIETSTSRMEVDSNYFEGGDAAHKDFHARDGWKEISIHHNVYYGILDQIVMFEAGLDGLHLYNNTIYYSSREAGGPSLLQVNGPRTRRNWTVANNVVVCPDARRGKLLARYFDAAVPAELTFKGNVVHNFDVNVAGLEAEDVNRYSLPGLREAGDRPQPFFLPKSAGSAAVDAGTTDGLSWLRFSGKAPDAGAFEFRHSSPTPTRRPTHPAAGRRMGLRIVSPGGGAAIFPFPNPSPDPHWDALGKSHVSPYLPSDR